MGEMKGRSQDRSFTSQVLHEVPANSEMEKVRVKSSYTNTATWDSNLGATLGGSCPY